MDFELPEGYSLAKEESIVDDGDIPVGYSLAKEVPAETKEITNPTKDNKFIKLTDEDYEKPNAIQRAKDELVAAGFSAGESFARIGKPIVEASAYSLEGLGVLSEEEENTVYDFLGANMKWYGEGIAKAKADRLMKYGEDSWGVGATIGELAPDIVSSTRTAASAFGSGLVEFGLSSARNNLFGDDEVTLGEKLKAITTDTAVALIGTSLVNKYLPSNQVEELDSAIQNIDDPVIKKKVTGAIEVMKEAGLDELDYGARDAILTKIVEGKITNNFDLSSIIRSKVDDAYRASKDIYTDLYTKAGEIGRQSVKTNSAELNSNFAKWMDADSGNNISNSQEFDIDSMKYIEAFEAELNKVSEVSAHEIEQLRKRYAGLSAHSKDEKKHTYGKIASFLEGEVDTLIKNSGIKENPYLKPRKAFKEHIDNYETRGDKTFGSKVEKFRKEGGDIEYNAAEELLGDRLDANKASKFVNTVTKDSKVRDSILSRYILKGMPEDIKEIGTDELRTIIGNFDRIDKDGLRIMIGTKKATEMTNQIEALSIVEQILKDRSIESQSIATDVANLVAATAAIKISPYASAHVAINTAKNIFDKSLKNKQNKANTVKTIMKKIYGTKNAELKKKLTRAVVLSLGLSTAKIKREEGRLPEKDELIETKRR